LVDPDAEHVLKFLKQVFAALEVAGRSHADLNVVPSGFGELEIVVEGYNAINLGQGKVDFPRQLEDGGAREIAKLLLKLMQNHDEAARFVFPVLDELCQMGRELWLGNLIENGC
jgi:hypothetical protein